MCKFKYVFGGIIVFIFLTNCIVPYLIPIRNNDNSKLNNATYSSTENALLALNENISNAVIREQFSDKELFIIYNGYIRFVVLKNNADSIVIENYSEKLSELNWTHNMQPFIATFEVDNKIITISIQSDKNLYRKNYIALSDKYVMLYQVE